MAAKDDLKKWLASSNDELINAIAKDIERHVNLLISSGETFYGLAACPGDYHTMPNPAILRLAFNREMDIDPLNTSELYYRYCVAEWSNEVADGFDTTNALLKSQFTKFKNLHTRDPEGFILDAYEIAFVKKTDQAILDALLSLRQCGLFPLDVFLIVWYHDLDYEIVNKSAKALNTPKMYNDFIAAFQ
jgi:hypothetical protein